MVMCFSLWCLTYEVEDACVDQTDLSNYFIKVTKVFDFEK